MEISSDYKDLFKILNKHKIKYLVVGAYAVIYYAEPRFTKDLDICIRVDAENANKLYAALKEFGAPLKGLSAQDFIKKNLVYQIGVAPIRIDIIMGLAAVDFDSAWKNRTRSRYAGIPINIIGIKELIKTKRKAGRLQDVLDLKKLLRVRKRTRNQLNRM